MYSGRGACLVSFTLHNCFQILPCFCMLQSCIPFYGWVIFHCMEINRSFDLLFVLKASYGRVFFKMCFERANIHLELTWPWIFIWLNQSVFSVYCACRAQKDFKSQPVVFGLCGSISSWWHHILHTIELQCF